METTTNTHTYKTGMVRIVQAPATPQERIASALERIATVMEREAAFKEHEHLEAVPSTTWHFPMQAFSGNPSD